jgi:hypothetical protein
LRKGRIVTEKSGFVMVVWVSVGAPLTPEVVEQLFYFIHLS